MGRASAASLLPDDAPPRGAHLGTVVRAPATADARLLVKVDAAGAVEAPWVARVRRVPGRTVQADDLSAHPLLALVMPAAGDQCAVLFDERGEPWVACYWPRAG